LAAVLSVDLSDTVGVPHQHGHQKSEQASEAEGQSRGSLSTKTQAAYRMPSKHMNPLTLLLSATAINQSWLIGFIAC